MTRDVRKVSYSQPDEHLEMGKLAFYMGCVIRHPKERMCNYKRQYIVLFCNQVTVAQNCKI